MRKLFIAVSLFVCMLFVCKIQSLNKMNIYYNQDLKQKKNNKQKLKNFNYSINLQWLYAICC